MRPSKDEEAPLTFSKSRSRKQPRLVTVKSTSPASSCLGSRVLGETTSIAIPTGLDRSLLLRPPLELRSQSLLPPPPAPSRAATIRLMARFILASETAGSFIRFQNSRSSSSPSSLSPPFSVAAEMKSSLNSVQTIV